MLRCDRTQRLRTSGARDCRMRVTVERVPSPAFGLAPTNRSNRAPVHASAQFLPFGRTLTFRLECHFALFRNRPLYGQEGRRFKSCRRDHFSDGVDGWYSDLHVACSATRAGEHRSVGLGERPARAIGTGQADRPRRKARGNDRIGLGRGHRRRWSA